MVKLRRKNIPLLYWYCGESPTWLGLLPGPGPAAWGFPLLHPPAWCRGHSCCLYCPWPWYSLATCHLWLLKSVIKVNESGGYLQAVIASCDCNPIFQGRLESQWTNREHECGPRINLSRPYVAKVIPANLLEPMINRYSWKGNRILVQRMRIRQRTTRLREVSS